jgi:hypothetical protein
VKHFICSCEKLFTHPVHTALSQELFIGMPFDFSSDLDVGRRPELKSDEKSKGIPIVLEISRCDFFYFSIHRSTLSEHHSSVDRVCVRKSNFLKVTACDSVKNVFSMVDLVG